MALPGDLLPSLLPSRSPKRFTPDGVNAGPASRASPNSRTRSVAKFGGPQPIRREDDGRLARERRMRSWVHRVLKEDLWARRSRKPSGRCCG